MPTLLDPKTLRPAPRRQAPSPMAVPGSPAAESPPRPEPAAEPQSKPDPTRQSVLLVPYPKIIFLYPLALGSLIAALAMTFLEPDGTAAAVVAAAWLGLLAFNLAVLAFDFPRTASLTLFTALFAVGLLIVLINVSQPTWLPDAFHYLGTFRPRADASFYWFVTGILGTMLGLVILMRRFDYWEVRPNELLHHHGFLSNLKRYSAPNLKIEKEINDVFEWCLLGSGTLVLHPKNEPRSIVLENVPGISKKERQITRMLGALQVSVRGDE